MKPVNPPAKPVYQITDANLPHHAEGETYVLGSIIMWAHEWQDLALARLSADCFYIKRNRLVWCAIEGINAKNQRADILSIAMWLRHQGLLDEVTSYYIACLTRQIILMPGVEYMMMVLQEYHQLRLLITYANHAVKQAYQPGADATEVYNTLVSKFEKTHLQPIESHTYKLFGSVLDDVETAIVRNKNSPLQSVPTGFSSFDSYCSGLQPGEVYIIAARPGMGKTAFALQLARNAAVGQNQAVIFYSLEMARKQLLNRLQAMECRLPLSVFKDRTLTPEQDEYRQKELVGLMQSPLVLDDTAQLTMPQILSNSKVIKSQYGLRLVVVDYLQLIETTGHGHTREQDVANISRMLKLMAKELQVPVVALSQLSRNVDQRTSKVPMLSDLRDSGAIEQDADMVCFLYRPHYYKQSLDSEGQLVTNPNLCELIVAKNRNGPTGRVCFSFDAEMQRFSEQ